MTSHPEVLFRTLLVASSLFLASHGLALGPPIPLTDPEIGGAWTRSQSASTVWTGQHFLSVWIETRESVSDGDWFLMAGRFSAEGERLDGHGIELATRPLILWAEVVIAAGEPHVVMHEPGTTLVARLQDEFELNPVASVEATMRRADVFAEAGRIAVGWSTDWEGPLHAAIVDVTTGSLTGPVAIADDGYVPSISGDGTRFVMVYNRDYYGEGRVEASFLSFDGTIEEQLVVEENTHRARPSVAFSGDQFLVAYGQPVRIRSMSLDGALGTIQSWSDYEIPSGYVEPAEAEIECGVDECLLIARTWEICEFSACAVRSELLMTRVDHDGHSLGEGWKVVPEESFGSYDQQIAVDGNRFFLTWTGDSFEHGRVYGTVISGSEITAPLQLSSGGRSQHDPVGADRGNQSLVVWSESAEDIDQSCLRAALIDRHGRTIADETISECGTRITSWAVSGDADSWLAVWSEYDDELRSYVTRGRIMEPHDLSGESFLIGQFRANQLSAAGGSAGHIVTWRDADAIYATRISATGQNLGEPWPVLFGRTSEPLLVNFGEGFALFWDGGYCPGEQCGFRYRFLTGAGETHGDPVTIGSRGFSFDAVETDDGDVLLVWRESAYEVLAAFVRRDGSIQHLGPIASTDGGGSLHVGRDDEGFVVAAELYDGSQGLGGEAVIIRLDSSGAVAGSPEHLPRRVREVVGNGLLIERRYVKSPPFYGAPRLFLRNVDEDAPRRRTMRPR